MLGQRAQEDEGEDQVDDQVVVPEGEDEAATAEQEREPQGPPEETSPLDAKELPPRWATDAGDAPEPPWRREGAREIREPPLPPRRTYLREDGVVPALREERVREDEEASQGWGVDDADEAPPPLPRQAGWRTHARGIGERPFQHTRAQDAEDDVSLETSRGAEPAAADRRVRSRYGPHRRTASPRRLTAGRRALQRRVGRPQQDVGQSAMEMYARSDGQAASEYQESRDALMRGLRNFEVAARRLGAQMPHEELDGHQLRRVMRRGQRHVLADAETKALHYRMAHSRRPSDRLRSNEVGP